MSMIKTIAAGALLAAVLGGAANAQGFANPGVLLFKDGSMRTIPAGSKMEKMIMPYAKAYDDGMIYVSGGRLYTVPNARMPNGHLLDEMLSPGNPNFEPGPSH